jgi:hypothetical protein
MIGSLYPVVRVPFGQISSLPLGAGRRAGKSATTRKSVTACVAGTG